MSWRLEIEPQTPFAREIHLVPTMLCVLLSIGRLFAAGLPERAVELLSQVTEHPALDPRPAGGGGPVGRPSWLVLIDQAKSF
ncbi:MAG: hypothetical protein JW900_15740 [Anaerolineae bacterium]|nr:hypothetical protein [Anaerolineae bacterium]